MMSLTLDRSFDCAPHAARSLAWALTLSLNLAIVLYALLPSTPFPARVAPAPPTFAVLQPPEPPPAPPVPTLQVAPRVAAPVVHRATPQPAPTVAPVLPGLAPVAPVAPTVAPAQGTEAAAPDSNAAVAFETATPPAYPVQALRAGIEGTVLLKVLVDATGKPAEVEIEHSSGSRLLDDAARRHVLAAWRFHPAIRDGHAIKAWAVVPVRFSLDRG